MQKIIKKIFFPQSKKEWLIEGPADTNMQLMRELGQLEFSTDFIDEESQVSFVCRIRNLPSIYHILNFSKIACTLQKVAPHRCYLTIKIISSHHFAIFFWSCVCLTTGIVFFIKDLYLALIFVPILFVFGIRFVYLANWMEQYRVYRFFKDKFFVIDNSTAS